MKIVKPNVELWVYGDDMYLHIARCARVCYATNNTLNDKKLVDSLWKRNHRSMYRHAPAYYIIPVKLDIKTEAFKDVDYVIEHEWRYISTNEQAAREYWDKKYGQYRISNWDASNHPIFRKHKLIRYTFVVENGIDITRELNRKSPNNIAEQSTRYVDFNKRIGIKFKKCHWMDSLNIYKKCLTWVMCKTSELFYKLSRSKYGLNLPPEDARWILPLDTMSKAVYTYSVKEWERIINLRLFDWTGKAHPDAKITAKQIYSVLISFGYDIENYKLKDDETKYMVQII